MLFGSYFTNFFSTANHFFVSSHTYNTRHLAQGLNDSLKWWENCSFLLFILGNHKGLPLRREKPKASTKKLFFYEVCRIIYLCEAKSQIRHLYP